MNESILFSSPARIPEVAFLSIALYILIVAVVRIQGKRTSSQFNNFDWIVNVAVGGVAATGILRPDVPLSDAALAIVMLSLAQWFVTWATLRWDWFATLVNAQPRLLVQNGELLHDKMMRERISEAEIRSTLRKQGICVLSDANWVSIESDGSLSVIGRNDREIDHCELMADVQRERGGGAVG